MSTSQPPSGTVSEKAVPSAAADEEKTVDNVAVPGGTEATLVSAPQASRDPGASSNGAQPPAKLATSDAQTATSSPTNQTVSPSRQAPRRKSAWKSIIAKLVPCISTSKAHDEPVQTVKDTRDSTSSESAPAKTDAEPAKETPAASPPPAPTPINIAPAPTTPTKPSPINTTSSAVQTDLEPPVLQTEVIVPPSPTHHLLPEAETAGVTSGAVQAPGSTGREEEEESQGASEDDDAEQQDSPEGTVPDEDDEDAIVLRGGLGIPIVNGVATPLLPPLKPEHAGRKCLVLDLDETLLHSSFKLIPQCDYVVPVEIEWQWHNVYVIKRPGVDQFLKKMGELFEIVVFTASLSKYADPVLDKLDIHKVVSHRLFRESCYNHKGNYVKDLSQLGRPLTETIILDNSPASYIFHPNNAVPVSSWFNDPHDTELTDLCPFLTDLRLVDDIRGVLDGGI